MPLNASSAEDVGVRCDNLNSVKTGEGRTPLRVEELDANAAQGEAVKVTLYFKPMRPGSCRCRYGPPRNQASESWL
jgi:hypothetical protein